MRVLGGLYGPEPHKGLLNCYEGTNITGEKVVNHYNTQLNDALIESYGRDNKNGGPDVDRRFFHFAKLGVILGLVRRDQFATKQ